MNAQSRFRAPKPQPIQADLFGGPQTVPSGFRYQADLLTAAEEASIVQTLQGMPFEPFNFHGHLANRHVVGFGWRYDYASRRLRAADDIPDGLIDLREKVAAFAAKPAEAFVQVLINAYRPGAGIGWHKDKPQFDDVVGVSLLSACPLRFRRREEETWTRRTVNIEARSAYLLSGAARSCWEHSIPPVGEARFSITFRTMVDDGVRRLVR